MFKARRKVEIHVDGYTRCCLTVIAVLLTVLIVALWAQPLTPSLERQATAASPIGGAAGIPDAGKQRDQMLTELRAVNSNLSNLIKMFEAGKAKVQVASDDKSGGK